jgi:signal-transduction protein with cAMP-binding, CBS, and nucleotidyltransferase domain
MAHTFVKDVMSKNVISIDSAMSIKDAATMMADTNVGCVVITKGNAPIGIVTERDFVKRIVSEDKDVTTPLAEVMSFPLISVNSDDTVWEAAETMKTHKIHKAPVEEQGKLIGIITATDLVKICSMGSDSEMRRIADSILTRLRNEDGKKKNGLIPDIIPDEKKPLESPGEAEDYNDEEVHSKR